jgi:hypothetical protein
MLPLFFQVVLQDTATTAGARLAIPSVATPIGGLVAGVVMSRWGNLVTLVRIGALFMTLGNGLVTSLSFNDNTWKYLVFIFPANLGQGIIYPATLFSTLASFDHSGKLVQFLVDRSVTITVVLTLDIRPCSIGFYGLPHTFARQCMGRRYHSNYSTEHPGMEITCRSSWFT